MSSLLSNSVSVYAARLVVPAFSFAINVGIARYFGPELLGVYVYLLALLVVFQTVAAAGLSPLLTRDLPGAPGAGEERLEAARRSAVLTGLLATGAFLLFTLLLVDPEWRAAAAVLALTLVPSAFMAVQEGAFFARRQHERVAVVAVVENVLKLLLALAAVLLGGRILALAVAIAVSRAVAAVVGEVLLQGRVPRLDLSGSGIPLPELTPWALLLAISMLYFRVDIVIVERVMAERDTGLYGAAWSLFTVILLVPTSAVAAVYPRLASSFRESENAFVEGSVLAAKLLTLGVVPVTLILIWIAPWALEVVYGSTYASAGGVLVLLAVALPFHAFNGVLGHALQASGRPRAVLGVVTTGLLSHVALLMLLLPVRGLEGAALAQIGSSALVSAGLTWSFARERSEGSRLSPGAWAAAATAAAAIVFTLMVPRPWTASAGALGCVLVAATVWIGALSPEEMRRIQRSLLPTAFRAPPSP